MTQIIVMGSSYDIFTDADLATTESAVRAFLASRGKFEIDSREQSSMLVVTPLPRQGIDRRKLAVNLDDHLADLFAEQPA